uniref:Cilia- and flagella-associated protein 74 n=1 Tax=Sus scrofa TaxID=9823 RepID=A0A8D0NUS5_PIG
MEEAAGLVPEETLVDEAPPVDDERDELEDPELVVESLREEAETRPGPGSTCPGREQNAEKRKQKPATQDRIQASRLRKNLHLLDKLHEEKDLFIQKTREELRACRRRMDFLAEQRKIVAAELATEREAGNVAAVGRLEAASRRLCLELERERDLLPKISAVLRENESTMWHLETQERQLQDVWKSVREEAAATGRCLRERTAKQLRQETEAAGKAERNQLLRVRKSMHLQRELGLRHQKLVADAQQNHRVAMKFLKASLGRVRERERKAELASREHVQRRMDAVLALKNSIAASRETLRQFHAWGRAKAELAEQKAQAEREAILAHGGDAFKHLCHQRRRQELEAQNRAFEQEQKLRKQEIVSRILKEEAGEHARKKQAPPKTTGRPSLRDKTWSHLAEVCDGKSTAPPSCPPLEDSSVPGATVLAPAISSESVQVDPSSPGWQEEPLVRPEIPGLWSQEASPHQVPQADAGRKPVGGTKTDQDLLARTIRCLHSGAPRRQVASRRKFRGRPFNSKPQLIHFKDFDVGREYEKKVILTNATYTINYCRLAGVEESLRDSVRVDFDPPGPMSAGMSCEVLVTFKPVVNKDLEGNISFLTQTGGFSVPLKCSTRKCSLSLDKQLIDFGSYVVGETASRTITLTNTGGLGTRFKFLLASESCEMDASHSVLKRSSLFTCEEKSFCDKVATSVSEQRMEGNESSLPEAPSQRESQGLDAREQVEGRPPESETVTTPPSKEQTEFCLGEMTEGEIAPFGSIRVPVIFTPLVPGTAHSRVKVVFQNQQCPTLHFRVVGVAVDVPVWVPKPDVDLKICMYDRLYQDSVLVHTRSKVALRLKFEVCKELRGHVELLPETGYIQAMSSFSVQLKFLPHSLPEDAGKYFDKESRVLEAPMTIQVADQIRPVGFTLHAVVTTSDLELSPSVVDFGYCTISEAVRTQVGLCNHSLLPQGFGFVRLPKCVDVQPNDGFGTILPLETLQLDVIFQPTKAKEYSFELVCKSEINRCFKLTCRAVGVRPPLELSHHQIKFAATSLYDTSVASLYVINSHVSLNSLTHSVPRIGSEDASPVGPTSFEFLLPPDLPITISPLVGTVWPGKQCLLQVAFRPVLPSELIHQEAFQALIKEAESKSSFRRDMATQKKDQRRQSVSILQLQNRDRSFRSSSSQPPELQKQDLTSSSQEYQAAQAALTRSFPGKFDKFVIPCVVASGDTKDRKGTEPLSFSPHNTLYLELWCPAVAPSIVVTSDKGKTISNFGDVAVGHHGLKKVSIQNICPEDLHLEYSVLNPSGPFVLLNPISRLPSGETQVLELSFSPRESCVAQETLDIVTKRGSLHLTLTGTGVASTVTCSIEGDVLHMGYVIAGESVSSGFKLQNSSSLPIKFSVQLDSLSTRTRNQHQLPQFLAAPAQRTEVVGTQNLSGQSVFSVVPVEGIMDPGRAQDFTVTFSPDHESLYFSDRLQVVLFEKKISHQIILKGAAREHMMFVEGGDPVDVPVESLAVIPAFDPERREEAEELKPILVTLAYVQQDTDTPAPPATRELQVGCIRTTQLSPKKPDHPLVASALLQLRGDVKETRKILFLAHVLTGP